MWQELRAELHRKGLEIVTVALDTGGEDAAGPWIDLAKPEHPALIDQAHLLDELLGVANVPTGVWIDEEGMIVRPGQMHGLLRDTEEPLEMFAFGAAN